MRRLCEREQMLVVAVHASFRNEAQQMQPMAVRCGQRLLQYLVSIQVTVSNGLVDAREVLINDASRAEIQMANFRVAHLPCR